VVSDLPMILERVSSCAGLATSSGATASKTNGLDRDFAHRPFDDSIEEPQLASMLASLANWTLGMDR
jgi:hypothetical protein